jgi:hypothetical protein
MRRSTFFWGTMLVLAGAILLLNNLGIFSVNVWGVLWPVFLIALGVWMVWGIVFKPSRSTEHVAIPLEGASRASVHLNHGAGRLRISSGAGPSNLVEGDFDGGLDFKARRDGDRLDLRMRVADFGFPMFWGPGSPLDWSINLNSELPLELEMETGANDARIDLSGLLVTDLRVRSGASSTDITLPAHAGFTHVDIGTGAASVNVHIPSGVAARMRVRGGLSSINIDSTRFPRFGDSYQSADYETAANKADLNVDMGVGSLSVD